MSDIPQFGFRADDLVRDDLTTNSNIEDIKKWLRRHPNIPGMSDEQIALFLIACNNAIETTQTTIESYFRYKANAPEFFASRDVNSEEMQFCFRVASFAVIPNRTKENYGILMGCLKDTYYCNFNLESLTKVAFTAIDRVLYSNPPTGLVIIINLKGVGLMHLTRLKLGAIKKMLAFLQEGLPTRLKQVHILNASYIFEKILVIFKPFMKKELFESIIPHSTTMPMEEFFENYIPASCMPSDYGGQLPSLEKLSEDLQNELRKLKPFLESDERQIQKYIENRNS